MSSKVKPNEGDWICQGKTSSGVCGNVNFSSRQKCNKCGTDLKKEWIYKKAGFEIGKQHADKSGGLFSADDWMCKSCGNINWARRVKCNVCNSSKHSKAENRTGLGGGFKDRDDVVEYKERAESDDEYDEFGMKKKQFRGTATAENSSKQENIHSQESDEAEAEEEEEDDDGDLDKYNLLDEDDVEDLVDKKPPQPIATRERSHHSSGSSASSSSSSASSSNSSDHDVSGSSSTGSGDSDTNTDASSSSSSSSGRLSTSSIGQKRGRPHSQNDKRKSSVRRSRSRSPLDKNGNGSRR